MTVGYEDAREPMMFDQDDFVAAEEQRLTVSEWSSLDLLRFFKPVGYNPYLYQK